MARSDSQIPLRERYVSAFVEPSLRSSLEASAREHDRSLLRRGTARATGLHDLESGRDARDRFSRSGSIYPEVGRYELAVRKARHVGSVS